MSYWDTSILVKLYAKEPDPAAFESYVLSSLLSTCYQQTPPILLRTLDAIHLATARVAGETELVATDKRLRDAAKLLGFALFPE